jgi:hypothetical protein
MKHRVLPVLAAAALTVTCWGALALACDKSAQSAQNASAGTTCTAAMASKCTPEQAAACKAKGATAAVAASSKGCAGMMGAVAMTSANCPHSATMAGADCCAKGAKGTTASVASASECAAHGTKTASMAGGNCAAHGAKTAGVASASECAAHGAKTASMAGGNCAAHGAAMAGAAMVEGGCSAYKSMAKGGDCDACADMANCENELRSAMTQTQIVPLKNGVMFVYTTGAPGQVRAVQAAMTRRYDRLTAITVAGDRAHLCPECKNLRGAVASGKLSRETVNIEGGCLTLMTSNDPSMIARLHAMAGLGAAGRKS